MLSELDVPPAGASVIDLFLSLVRVPSPSGRERHVADLIQGWLAQHGVSAELDGSGHLNDSEAGNLVARIEGSPGVPALLFVAHMDTVEGGDRPVAPRRDGDVVRSDGQTILGADNKSAVAAVMRLCARLSALSPQDRPTVVAAFTCREEAGRMGASLLTSLGEIDCAFCVDGSRPVGTIITRALGQAVYTFEIQGRAAHAAASPEQGIDAIRVACEVVAELPLGRRADGGSASVAAIVGGAVLDKLASADGSAEADPAVAAIMASPTNSIAARALLRGEVRGYSTGDIERALEEVDAIVHRVCDGHGATFRRLGDRARMVPPYPGDPGSRALGLVRSAVAALPELTLVEEPAHATLEANYLASGTDVVAVASGGRDPHRLTESIEVAELERLESLLAAIVAASSD